MDINKGFQALAKCFHVHMLCMLKSSQVGDRGLFAQDNKPISKGTVIMSVPLSLCLIEPSPTQEAETSTLASKKQTSPHEWRFWMTCTLMKVRFLKKKKGARNLKHNNYFPSYVPHPMLYNWRGLQEKEEKAEEEVKGENRVSEDILQCLSQVTCDSIVDEIHSYQHDMNHLWKEHQLSDTAMDSFYRFNSLIFSR
ncbi:hypothetical protein RFI_03273, partial [Reticulomyxa filosa]